MLKNGWLTPVGSVVKEQMRRHFTFPDESVSSSISTAYDEDCDEEIAATNKKLIVGGKTCGTSASSRRNKEENIKFYDCSGEDHRADDLSSLSSSSYSSSSRSTTTSVSKKVKHQDTEDREPSEKLSRNPIEDHSYTYQHDNVQKIRVKNRIKVPSNPIWHSNSSSGIQRRPASIGPIGYTSKQSIGKHSERNYQNNDMKTQQHHVSRTKSGQSPHRIYFDSHEDDNSIVRESSCSSTTSRSSVPASSIVSSSSSKSSSQSSGLMERRRPPEEEIHFTYRIDERPLFYSTIDDAMPLNIAGVNDEFDGVYDTNVKQIVVVPGRDVIVIGDDDVELAVEKERHYQSAPPPVQITKNVIMSKSFLSSVASDSIMEEEDQITKKHYRDASSDIRLDENSDSNHNGSILDPMMVDPIISICDSVNSPRHHTVVVRGHSPFISEPYGYKHGQDEEQSRRSDTRKCALEQEQRDSTRMTKSTTPTSHNMAINTVDYLYNLWDAPVPAHDIAITGISENYHTDEDPSNFQNDLNEEEIIGVPGQDQSVRSGIICEPFDAVLIVGSEDRSPRSNLRRSPVEAIGLHIDSPCSIPSNSIIVVDQHNQQNMVINSQVQTLQIPEIENVIIFHGDFVQNYQDWNDTDNHLKQNEAYSTRSSPEKSSNFRDDRFMEVKKNGSESSIHYDLTKHNFDAKLPTERKSFSSSISLSSAPPKLPSKQTVVPKSSRATLTKQSRSIECHENVTQDNSVRSSSARSSSLLQRKASTANLEKHHVQTKRDDDQVSVYISTTPRASYKIDGNDSSIRSSSTRKSSMLLRKVSTTNSEKRHVEDKREDDHISVHSAKSRLSHKIDGNNPSVCSSSRRSSSMLQRKAPTTNFEKLHVKDKREDDHVCVHGFTPSVSHKIGNIDLSIGLHPTSLAGSKEQGRQKLYSSADEWPEMPVFTVENEIHIQSSPSSMAAVASAPFDYIGDKCRLPEKSDAVIQNTTEKTAAFPVIIDVTNELIANSVSQGIVVSSNASYKADRQGKPDAAIRSLQCEKEISPDPLSFSGNRSTTNHSVKSVSVKCTVGKDQSKCSSVSKSSCQNPRSVRSETRSTKIENFQDDKSVRGNPTDRRIRRDSEKSKCSIENKISHHNASGSVQSEAKMSNKRLSISQRSIRSEPFQSSKAVLSAQSGEPDKSKSLSGSQTSLSTRISSKERIALSVAHQDYSNSKAFESSSNGSKLSEAIGPMSRSIYSGTKEDPFYVDERFNEGSEAIGRENDGRESLVYCNVPKSIHIFKHDEFDVSVGSVPRRSLVTSSYSQNSKDKLSTLVVDESRSDPSFRMNKIFKQYCETVNVPGTIKISSLQQDFEKLLDKQYMNNDNFTSTVSEEQQAATKTADKIIDLDNKNIYQCNKVTSISKEDAVESEKPDHSTPQNRESACESGNQKMDSISVGSTALVEAMPDKSRASSTAKKAENNEGTERSKETNMESCSMTDNIAEADAGFGGDAHTKASDASSSSILQIVHSKSLNEHVVPGNHIPAINEANSIAARRAVDAPEIHVVNLCWSNEELHSVNIPIVEAVNQDRESGDQEIDRKEESTTVGQVDQIRNFSLVTIVQNSKRPEEQLDPPVTAVHKSSRGSAVQRKQLEPDEQHPPRKLIRKSFDNALNKSFPELLPYDMNEDSTRRKAEKEAELKVNSKKMLQSNKGHPVETRSQTKIGRPDPDTKQFGMQIQLVKNKSNEQKNDRKVVLDSDPRATKKYSDARLASMNRKVLSDERIEKLFKSDRDQVVHSTGRNDLSRSQQNIGKTDLLPAAKKTKLVPVGDPKATKKSSDAKLAARNTIVFSDERVNEVSRSKQNLGQTELLQAAQKPQEQGGTLDEQAAPTVATIHQESREDRLSEFEKSPLSQIESAPKIRGASKHINLSTSLADLGDTLSTISDVGTSFNTNLEDAAFISFEASQKVQSPEKSKVSPNYQNAEEKEKPKSRQSAKDIISRSTEKPLQQLPKVSINDKKGCPDFDDLLSIDCIDITGSIDISALDLLREDEQTLDTIENLIETERYTPFCVDSKSFINGGILGLEYDLGIVKRVSPKSKTPNPSMQLGNETNESRQRRTIVEAGQEPSSNIASASLQRSESNKATPSRSSMDPSSYKEKKSSKGTSSNGPKQKVRNTAKNEKQQKSKDLERNMSPRSRTSGSINKYEVDNHKHGKKDIKLSSRKASSPPKGHTRGKEQSQSFSKGVNSRDSISRKEYDEKSRNAGRSSKKYKEHDKGQSRIWPHETPPNRNDDLIHLERQQKVEGKSTSRPPFPESRLVLADFNCFSYRDETDNDMSTTKDSGVGKQRSSSSSDSPHEEDFDDFERKKMLWRKNRKKLLNKVTFDHIITELSLEVLDSQETGDIAMEMIFSSCNKTSMSQIISDHIFGRK